MTLRRQLLLVSLLTLVLPWAGCQFIRETESALREGQQQMLSGTALAIADSLAQFPDEFALSASADQAGVLYGHPLASAPLIDGYFDDWPIPPGSLRTMRGVDGQIRYAIGIRGQHAFLYVDVRDNDLVYAGPGANVVSDDIFSDRVMLVTGDEAGITSRFDFVAEAPGSLVAINRTAGQRFAETRILAQWEDTATGYQLEARVPRHLLNSHLGVIVTNTENVHDPGIRSSSYSGRLPGRLATASPLLQSVVSGYAELQPGVRLIVTDRAGWRLAQAGDAGLSPPDRSSNDPSSRWLRIAYSMLLEPGKEARLAEPHPSGREQQNYVAQALNAMQATSWFRSRSDGRAVVALAQPIWAGTVQTGVVILQQGTDAILSLTNQSLARLMSFTLIATLVAAAVLLGYSSWLSLRIRRLSAAADSALDGDIVHADLPSALANDEIGDLARSFASVLRQLGEYNEYLRALAARLSHEMRTPLTIVTSSLENLEHEPLTDEAANYTSRAKDGATRLKNILNAMSEASKVEEIMGNVDFEHFNLHDALTSTVAAYGDAYPERRFSFNSDSADVQFEGAPELIIQMLDKLADNAVEFSAPGDRINIVLSADANDVIITVSNPGPPLPEKMRTQLFDSLVSVRDRNRDKHLGLGLYIARLIAEGHGGTISASNTEQGVAFQISLPADT